MVKCEVSKVAVEAYHCTLKTLSNIIPSNCIRVEAGLVHCTESTRVRCDLYRFRTLSGLLKVLLPVLWPMICFSYVRPGIQNLDTSL